MNEKKLKEIIEKQIDNFLYAGEVALELRNKGLKKNNWLGFQGGLKKI